MRDLIDRQAAIALAKDIIVPTKDGSAYKHRCIDPDEIRELPSAQPERPRGWFIEELIPYEGRRTITCSECGKELSTGPVIGVNYFRRGWRYCPYCGAQMGTEGEE